MGTSIDDTRNRSEITREGRRLFAEDPKKPENIIPDALNNLSEAAPQTLRSRIAEEQTPHNHETTEPIMTTCISRRRVGMRAKQKKGIPFARDKPTRPGQACPDCPAIVPHPQKGSRQQHFPTLMAMPDPSMKRTMTLLRA
ncbi:hypothetical protein [Gordonibacter sp. An230]|uniref:hypothetical protein n=1 Tax=Gordonibacter sp. An230 TaxID=1965592 RepID=UPI001120A2E1|nr:hypothetical protein [Gordonibacter sp. An230]